MGTVKRGVLMAALLAATIAAVGTAGAAGGDPTNGGAGYTKTAVVCHGSDDAVASKMTCEVVNESSSWTALASHNLPAYNSTGFAKLHVQTHQTESSVSDAIAAFGAGYVEGLVTAEMIYNTFLNLEPEKDKKVSEFVNANVEWTTNMIASNKRDPYWRQVGLVFDQLHGLVAGYNAHGWFPALTFDQLLKLNMLADLATIDLAVHPSRRPNVTAMDRQELQDFIARTTHCSAMVKVTDDLSDLMFTHTTWCPYSQMLRIFKVYTLRFSTVSGVKTETVMFSGYPALLAGFDDYYITSHKMAIMETTNGIYNNTLYDMVTPKSLLYWVRVMVATRLTSTGRAWHDVFYRYNSGTYNNAWMTIDYKLFTPGEPLPHGIFWVSEQVPGAYVLEDQTMQLQRNYWPSYNKPYYPWIYNVSGYPAVERVHGKDHTYQLAPRAKIFRRDAGAVETVEDLKTFMRMNHFRQGDPLAPAADAAIAARRDLDPNAPRADGAIDAKIVTAAMVGNMSVWTIAGPTHDTQPVFAWEGMWANQTLAPHHGHVSKFAFDWHVVSLADME